MARILISVYGKQQGSWGSGLIREIPCVGSDSQKLQKKLQTEEKKKSIRVGEGMPPFWEGAGKVSEGKKRNGQWEKCGLEK